jgi:hypothetical protein
MEGDEVTKICLEPTHLFAARVEWVDEADLIAALSRASISGTKPKG